jgi:tetratricopeptide (TPR) repeat protein
MNSVRALAVIIVALLSLAVGCGEQSAASGPAGASIAPASAAFFVSIRTDSNSEQWQQAEDLIAKFPDGRRAVESFLSELSSKGVDFETELQPALGPETDIVGLDLTGEGEFVGLTQPDDVQKLKDVLAKLDETMVTREVEGWTAFAESEAALDQFESAREGGALDAAGDYQDAMSQVNEDALALIYVNGSAIQEEVPTDQGVPPEALDSLFGGKVPSMAFSLAAEGDGAKVEGAALLADENLALAPDNFTAELPEEVPGGALLYVGFNDLEQALSAYRDALAEADPNVDRDIARVEAEVGVSLEEDVFPLFADEAALYVRPGFLIPEVTLVTHVEDEQAAMTTVDKIVEALGEYVPAAQHVNDVEIDGIAAKEVAVSPPISVYYAAFDGHLVLTTSRDGIAQLRQDDDRLADDSAFKDALEQAGMPDETAGFAYVNLHDAIPFVLNYVGTVPDEVRRNLEPLQSLVLYSTKDGRTLKFAGVLGVD